MKITDDGLWNIIGDRFYLRRADFPLGMIETVIQRVKMRVARIKKIDYSRTYFSGGFKFNFAGRFVLIKATF